MTQQAGYATGLVCFGAIAPLLATRPNDWSHWVGRAFYLLLATFYLLLPTAAQAAEAIPSFDARITVSANATVEVAEHIVYDFGTDKRHGIFRSIPYSYQAGTETYTADISSVTVTDGKGNPLPFNESRAAGELTLKIGDPNVVVTGPQAYVITYVVKGPFLYFDEHDEFYWNVTGDMPAPIARASVLVDLPYGAQVLDATCYQGRDNTPDSCTKDERLVNVERAGYHAVAEKMEAHDGFTVAVAFPKGVIAEVEKPWSGEDRIPLALVVWSAVLPLLALFGMGALWYTRGRDPKGKGTIVTQFEPPEKLSPSLAGLLFDERVDMRDITAELIELAVGGHLRIHRIERPRILFPAEVDYLLERTTTEPPHTATVGSLLLERLFQSEFQGSEDVQGRRIEGTLLSKMKHKWLTHKQAIEKRVYEDAVSQGFFTRSPLQVRMAYMGAGLALFVVGFFTTSYVGVGGILAGFCVVVVGYFMPVKTSLGVELRDEVEGFKRYLAVAEKDRLDFHNAPERTPELFDRYLPYAIALGVEDKWAAQFADMALSERSWYTGSPGSLTALTLAHDLSQFSRSVASATAPSGSGASGGGHVGGGFGGGRGGSW